MTRVLSYKVERLALVISLPDHYLAPLALNLPIYLNLPTRECS